MKKNENENLFPSVDWKLLQVPGTQKVLKKMKSWKSFEEKTIASPGIGNISESFWFQKEIF